MSRRLSLSLLFGFLTSLAARDAFAEAPTEVRAIDLREAIAHARAHHPRLLAAKRRLEAARREADVPGAQWLPRVGAFAEVLGATTNNSTATLLNVPTVDIPRVGATKLDGTYEFQPYPTTAVAVGVRQQLFDFGRVAAERAALDLAAEAERYRTTGAALDLDLAVTQAYYAERAARAVFDASHSAYERAVVHRDTARANVQSGMRAPIEATRAEADVARYEAGMTRAEGALHVARAVLAVSVGVDDIELEAATDEPASRPLESLAELVARANRSPVVREGKARAEAQRAETKRLDAQTRPTVYATASVNGRAGGAPANAGPSPYGEGWLPVVPNYSGGVVFAWPLLEPTWDKRAAASRERERSFDAETDLALRTQRATIAVAYRDAIVGERALVALERGAEAAKANYEQAEGRFRVGLGTSTELADAQAVRTEADIQLAIGRFQRVRARAVLERAIAEVP